MERLPAPTPRHLQTAPLPAQNKKPEEAGFVLLSRFTHTPEQGPDVWGIWPSLGHVPMCMSMNVYAIRERDCIPWGDCAMAARKPLEQPWELSVVIDFGALLAVGFL